MSGVSKILCVDYQAFVIHEVLGGTDPLLTYLRYNAELTPTWLKKHVNLVLSPKEMKKLYQMDEPENMKLLIRVGKAAAKQVQDSHLPAVFDVA